jgi:ferrochelatase
VAAVRDLIAERAWEWPDRAAIGCLPANHDVCPLDCCPAPQRPAGTGRPGSVDGGRPTGPPAAGGRPA